MAGSAFVSRLTRGSYSSTKDKGQKGPCVICVSQSIKYIDNIESIGKFLWFHPIFKAKMKNKI